ncbi:LysR family transcriptional regulator [Kineococcus rhizosphaerae]|uniref:DNA-binding transcriptional LysR family regulator n=1 Tax=Kineococcus rhizosphaerae TaxID=559628 RepID=A0A2T0R1K6_9ACTN|nr:LysR family transcriptional regulator [Kineococcus rhizosphaerae]PRY13393.1 DNA-binding transcriptional LysR family regulator [Kineococcus rhizosphaerae]
MVNLLNTDLNLLVPLDALLTERNVTRAGARIGVSQPAMSAALGRLRRQFDDELLVRVGSQYALTPLAEDLAGRVRDVLRRAEETLRPTPGFDPANSTREFSLISSDYAVAVLAPLFMARLRHEAPDVKVRIASVDATAIESPQTVLRSADLLFTPRGQTSGIPSTDLFGDHWVCISGTPRPAGRLDEQGLRRSRWARAFADHGGTAADRQVDELVVGARVDLVVDSLALLPTAIAGTDLLALVPNRLVARAELLAVVHRVEVPLPPMTLREAAWWHPSVHDDAGHRWFRRLVRDAARELPPDSPASQPEPVGVGVLT